MTIDEVKELLLDRIGDVVKAPREDNDDAHYYASVFEILCRAETQTKMTAHAIAECENPFTKGEFDD